MSLNNRHIVSKVSWETKIDKQGFVHHLQDKVSGWNSIYLEREILRVFDQVCPEDQIWKIQRLELDLGDIPFDEFERESQLRLASRLQEHITSYILNRYAHKDNVQIIHKKAALLDNLETYLLAGHFANWDEGSRLTFKELVKTCITDDRAAFAKSIFKVGKSEHARKRMAWQLKTEQLETIVEMIEPNNYQQILSFRSELETIQYKKKIVSSSQESLSKNIWYWILTHLLTQRGTLFNMVAYTRSVLEQMAAHYNMSFQVLSELILSALQTMRVKDTNQEGLITVLTIILEKREKNTLESNEVSFWDLLNVEISNGNTFDAIDDLVVSLVRRDPQRFQKLLNSIRKENQLLGFFQAIKPSSVRTVFREIFAKADYNYHAYINSIDQLFQLNTKDEIRLMSFMLASKASTKVHRQTVLKNYLEHKEKARHQLDQLQLLKSQSAKTKNEFKNLFDLDLYQDLLSLYRDDLAGTRAFKTQFKIAVKELLKAPFSEKRKIDDLIKADAVKSLDIIFQLSQDKKEKVLNCLLENEANIWILARGKKESASVLNMINDLTKVSGHMLHQQRQFLSVFIKCIFLNHLLDKTMGVKQLIHISLGQIILQLNRYELEVFKDLLTVITRGNKFETNVSHYLETELQVILPTLSSDSLEAELTRSFQNNPDEASISRFLEANGIGRDFYDILSIDTVFKTINYLAKNKREVSEFYIEQLDRYKNDGLRLKKFKRLFWRDLLAPKTSNSWFESLCKNELVLRSEIKEKTPVDVDFSIKTDRRKALDSIESPDTLWHIIEKNSLIEVTDSMQLRKLVTLLIEKKSAGQHI